MLVARKRRDSIEHAYNACLDVLRYAPPKPKAPVPPAPQPVADVPWWQRKARRADGR
jgi:hypothetical protein